MSKVIRDKYYNANLDNDYSTNVFFSRYMLRSKNKTSNK